MSVEIRPAGRVPEGDVLEWTVTSPMGSRIRLATFGATLASVEVPDAEGRLGVVTLGYGSTAALVSAGNPPYFGSTVGRFANRIGSGIFDLDGRRWTLECNDGPNHLHGGTMGFAKRLWRAESYEDRDGVSVRFSLSSRDGDQGYPGGLDVVAVYTLGTDGELTFSYEARCDAPTIVNLTNHAYWNLSGRRGILDHVLKLDASRYLESDAALLPTGNLRPVSGTPFDFTRPRRVGERVAEVGLGYDHCYVVDGGGGADLASVADLWDPSSGRRMTVATTQPAVQLYTGNFLDRAGFERHQALCLETQNYPDSPNRPAFPSPVLRPGQAYRHRTVHRFSIQR